MARNHENDTQINEALEDFGRHERVQKSNRRQKIAHGLAAFTLLGTAYVGVQAGNNEALKQEASEAADESYTSASEAEANTKRLGNELTTAIEDGTITPIMVTAENGDGYSTLREIGLERMYEDGEEVKGAEGTVYSPLPVPLIEEVNGESFPRVGKKYIAGYTGPEEFAENFQEQIEANPPTAGPR